MTASLLERPTLIDTSRPAAPAAAPIRSRQRGRVVGAVGDRAEVGTGSPTGDEPTGGRAGRRTAAYVLAGAAPVVAGAAIVLGVAPASAAPIMAGVPLLVVALIAVATRIDGGRRARTGMFAGLATVVACYAMEMPLVATGIWPDFVPDLGGTAGPAAGSLWTLLGSGGVGMFAFMLVGLLLVVRPHLINRRTVAGGAGYLIFVWTGLMGTMMLPGGVETPFILSPAGFIGHLGYGALLAVGLPIAVRHITSRGRTSRRRAA